MPSCHLVCSSTIVIVIVSAIWIVSFSPLNCQVSIFISAGPVPGSMPEKKVLPKYFLWTVMLEKTLENTMDCKKIKPVNPKGNLPWIFIGRTDPEAPILWPLDAKNWLIEKDYDAGKDWGQVEKVATEDQMVEWRHWLYGYEFEQVPGVGDGQGGVACCNSWGRKESDTTERLNWTKLNWRW